jgi:Na+-driven multidrug efflux pump
MDVFNWGLFTSFIVGSFGAVWLASHNAAMGFMQLCFMPAVGLNQGISAIVGFYIGKRRYDRASSRTYTAMKLASVYMFLAGLAFAVFGRQLIALFFSKDPQVIEFGHILLILSAAWQAFDAINIISMGALRGAGDTRWMAMVTFLLNYFFFLPLAMTLAFVVHLGAIGAWIGATCHIIILSGILFTRFAKGKWQQIRIFSEDTEQADVPSNAVCD